MAVLQMSPDQINALDPTQRASVMQLVRKKGLQLRCAIQADGDRDNSSSAYRPGWGCQSLGTGINKRIHLSGIQMPVTHGLSDQKSRGSNSVYASTSSGQRTDPDQM